MIRKSISWATGPSSYTLTSEEMQNIERPVHRLSTLANRLPTLLGLSDIVCLSHLSLLDSKSAPPTHADSILWVYVECANEGSNWLKHRVLADGRAALSAESTLGYDCCPTMTSVKLNEYNRVRARDVVRSSSDARQREWIERALAISEGAAGVTGFENGDGTFVLDSDSDEDGDDRDSEAQTHERMTGAGSMSVMDALSAPRLP